MSSNYERNQFKMRFLGISILCLGMIAIVYGIVMQSFDLYLLIIESVVVVCLLILFLITFPIVNHAYEEMESVSNLMVEVMVNDKKIEVAEYQEGSVGILYSNFEKMVFALQQSRQKELDEKLFLRDIISDISHQLKTPLASLNVFLDLLVEDKIKDPEKKQQVLHEAQNQLNRMEWMVLSMLKLARIEAGVIVFDKKETKLMNVLSPAVEAVRYLVDERKQTVTVLCDEDVAFSCDGDWLTEAIINLLKNASDYSGEGKTITIEVEHSPIYTRISVKDQGVGIEEAELPNVFKRFYRVHQEVNPNSVGIGLALTKSIVEGMGGKIHVDSKVGEYTNFVMTFVK